MKRYKVSACSWSLSGWTPELWRLFAPIEAGSSPDAEVPAMPAHVPGSVQAVLREAGVIPDWDTALDARGSEWVENRDWIYEATLPDEWFTSEARSWRLVFEGLDYRGEVWWNGACVDVFANTHLPHTFTVTPDSAGNRLRVIFQPAPRWLGQFGYTGRVRDWKTRFHYTWDWTCRLVQAGFTGDVWLEAHDGHAIEQVWMHAGFDTASRRGTLRVHTETDCLPGDCVRIVLWDADRAIRSVTLDRATAVGGVEWDDLDVQPWWPNGAGDRRLYDVTVELLDEAGEVRQVERRTVGFRSIRWDPCAGAPEGADPWLCVINDVPVFLQGVNYPPVRPNTADVEPERVERLLTLYRDLGVNTLRVNGVGPLETEWFYTLCDRLGLLVWQDMPLSSSGVQNEPPHDAPFAAQCAEIMRSYIARRHHHASLLMWCGGNELIREEPKDVQVPCDLTHPALKAMADVVAECDPDRRFVATTGTGPRFYAHEADFGKGLHWDVHGPWKLSGSMDDWRRYWAGDDALFRSEVGAPGAAPLTIIDRYRGTLDLEPITRTNPAWGRPFGWWMEDQAFRDEIGREPADPEEYIAWSQRRQAEALAIAVSACKKRFPNCGGVLLWCGHDCWPCATNTSIIDYHLTPKPAALVLQQIWLTAPEDLA